MPFYVSYLLREKIDIPIIGIEPGIRPAILNTKSKNIGVLATEKTLESKLFNSTSKNNLTDDITIHEQIGYGLVNEIEKGVNGNILIEKYCIIKHIFLNTLILIYD